jgi:CubicO group peptidase (beta-lactamase class C family)
MNTCHRFKLIAMSIGLCIFSNSYAAQNYSPSFVKQVVTQTIKPLMEKEHIPGMAVAITINGQSYFCNYGLASLQTRRPITNQTLFDVGSITKIFTTTLASYLDISKEVSLSDSVVNYVPELRGSVFENVSLLNLATHTSGLPLFEPPQSQNFCQYLDYLRKWRPAHPISTQRVYSNNGIGLLGIALEHATNDSYEHLLSAYILVPFGLTQTYFILTNGAQKNDAQGYTEDDQPAASDLKELMVSAYGLKSCSKDLLHYLKVNLGEVKLPSMLQQAVINTHTVYFETPYLLQDLGWEQLPFPQSLDKLLNANSDNAMDSTAKAITPPLKPMDNVIIDKTGTTNGFSTYVLFVPEKKVGIVLLANKKYPIPERVAAAYTILSKIT